MRDRSNAVATMDNKHHLVVVVCLTLACVASLLLAVAEGKSESQRFLDDVKRYDSCVVGSVTSFLYKDSYPPKTMEEFKNTCRKQSEAFKCAKEGAKNSTALIKRGMTTFIGTRQRHHRRYCGNLEGDQAKRFVQMNKCIMEKRFKAFKDNDAEMVQSLMEIERRNYNESAKELKQICCTFYNFKRNFLNNLGQECENHKSMIDELVQTVVTDDLTLVCEDEDKLAKLCPKLEQLQFERDPNFQPPPGRSPAVVGMYLFLTLGEPNEKLPITV